ncbi:MAG: transcriptional repressor LexA [bacterium]|mgnify:CR=1 FL=1|nr:transcriptional repressor LexA [bacterium]MDY2830879.1 transcriptional repressor LexA [Alphaproteobacteria bacterium]
MLTPKQYKLLMFINKTLKETGCCPSFDEMKDALGLKSKSGIHALIDALVERNFIRKLPHKARALEVVRLPKLKPSSIIAEEKAKEEALVGATAEIPLYGKIAAGTPIEAIANETEKMTVPLEMIRGGAYYALTIEGDSMVEAGIMNGDTVIIKRADTARDGEIVVALVDDNEATLKQIKRDGRYCLLIPKNSAYETRRLPAERVKVQGILSSLIRTYH